MSRALALEPPAATRPAPAAPRRARPVRRAPAAPGGELARVALRRSCSCGGTPGPAGECAQCRSRRLQRQSLPSPAEARERATEVAKGVRDGIIEKAEAVERMADALGEKAERAAEVAGEAAGRAAEEVETERERWWTGGGGQTTQMDFDGFELRVSGAIPLTVPAVSGLRATNPKSGGVDWTGSDKQDEPNKGPIPEGKYYLEPSEVETKGFPSGPWGNYRTRLHESWTTAVWRSATTERTAGFFLHQDGGNDGTAGCIGLSSDHDNKAVHGLILANSAPIPVYVQYLPPSKVAPGTPPAGAPVQRSSLLVGSASDPAEAEADRVAERAMRGSEPLGVARSAAGGAGEGPAPPIVHEVLRGSGAPLDGATRGDFERRLGLDLSGVRVHEGDRAAESARAVDAAAYTVGSDIVFGAGRYAPQSAAGRRLLAHELAHVAQQAGPAEPELARAPSASTLRRVTLDTSCDASQAEVLGNVTRAQASAAGWARAALSALDRPEDIGSLVRRHFGVELADIASIAVVRAYFQSILRVLEADGFTYHCLESSHAWCRDEEGEKIAARAPSPGSDIYFCDPYPHQDFFGHRSLIDTLLHEAAHAQHAAFNHDTYEDDSDYPGSSPRTNADSYAGFARDVAVGSDERLDLGVGQVVGADQFYIYLGGSTIVGGPALDIVNLQLGTRTVFTPETQEGAPARLFSVGDVGVRLTPVGRTAYIDLATGGFAGGNISDAAMMAGIAARLSAGYRGDRSDLGLDVQQLWDLAGGEDLLLVGVRGTVNF